MEKFDRKLHWEIVFDTKDTRKVSWYQPVPETSLRLIRETGLPLSSAIIDVGAGDSYMADHLLNLGYSDISLPDISGLALKAIRKRMGRDAERIRFIEADVLDFQPERKFDIWHDRAVFHFFTERKDIEKYVEVVSSNLVPGGYLIVGTFSENGPESCSGLKVQRYSEEEMENTFNRGFEKIRCFTENHTTPSGSEQNFRFGVFRKI